MADNGVETLDVATAAVVAVAALATIAYVWLPTISRLQWLRVSNEIVLEIGLFVLLVMGVVNFRDDTIDQRKRIKVGVAVMHATAAYSVAAFGVVLVYSWINGRESAKAVHMARRASKSAWVLFLVSSLGLFVAFMTVFMVRSNDRSSADAFVIGLFVPSLVAVAVLAVHVVMSFVNCFRDGRSPFSWSDTSGYHPVLHKILTTVFALFSLVFPIALLAANGVDTVSNETSSAKDAVTFLIDVLAAMIHRDTLEEFGRARKVQDDALREEEIRAQVIADGNASKDVPTVAV